MSTPTTSSLDTPLPGGNGPLQPSTLSSSSDGKEDGPEPLPGGADPDVPSTDGAGSASVVGEMAPRHTDWGWYGGLRWDLGREKEQKRGRAALVPLPGILATSYFGPLRFTDIHIFLSHRHLSGSPSSLWFFASDLSWMFPFWPPFIFVDLSLMASVHSCQSS